MGITGCYSEIMQNETNPGQPDPRAQRISDRICALNERLRAHHARLVELRSALQVDENCIEDLHVSISHTKDDIAYNEELLGRWQAREINEYLARTEEK